MTENHADDSESSGRAHASGWLYGFLLGLAVSLAILPPVRSLVLSQAEYATTQHNAEAAAVQRRTMTAYERAQMTRAALSNPDDYLIQVGRATADPSEMPANRRGRTMHSTIVSPPALVRIGQLPVHFPSSPGAYAHLSRYMMADRVHLLRPELFHAEDPQEGTPYHPAESDISLTEWALRTGEKHDKNNAYWPLMLAVTAYSVGRDEDGADALSRAATKTRWDSYIYEEVLGQWRMLSSAYGEIGALQKIGPLSLVSFPHLREIRRMGRVVRALADREQEAGLLHQSAMRRIQLMRAGEVLVNHAPWAYEALVGGDLITIAAADRIDNSGAPAIASVPPPGFIKLVQDARLNSNIDWITAKVKQAQILRDRVDVARLDTSYPGIPPGIPVANLVGTWMAGVSVLQEAALALLCIGIAIALELINTTYLRIRRPLCVATTVFALVNLGFTLSSAPSATRWMWTMISICVAVVQAIYWKAASGKPAATARPSTTARILPWAFAISSAALSGCLTVLYRPLLSTMHPVAAALYSLTDTSLIVNQHAAFCLAITACVTPAFILLGQGMSVFIRRRTRGGDVGSPFVLRTAVPCMICILGLYVALMNRTLLLDRQYSKALSDAARNDLQWVLMHSSNSN